MTQSSRPQADNQANGYVDAGPYSYNQWAERMYAIYTGDENTTSERMQLRGVVPTFDEMLVVENPSGVIINVGTGAGFSGGSFLYNSATVAFNATTPLIASRTDKVVLVENNTNAAYDGTASGVVLDFPADLTDYEGTASVPAYACRLAILRGNAVTGNPTTLIQTGSYWMIELFRFDISNVPAVSNLIDNREFINIEKIVGVHSNDDDTIKDALILGTEVNDDVGADELGVGIRFILENDNDDNEDAGQVAMRWTDSANGSEDARYELRLSAGNVLNLSAVANAPTAASADGNARGVGAVDFQQTRANATEVASGDYAFVAGGRQNTASGDYSFSSGFDAVASGDYAHAEGYQPRATADYTHAEGFQTTASASGAHAEGNNTTASGVDSHASGNGTVAAGAYSYAIGADTNADGDYSFAGGRQADTNTFDGVFIWGDSINAGFTADWANQFKIRANGGVKFVTTDTGAALPVATYDQADIDEPFHKFIGDAAAATLTRDLVDEGDVTTATRIGFYKIEILDDGNQITDGDYYVPFYSLA